MYPALVVIMTTSLTTTDSGGVDLSERPQLCTVNGVKVLFAIKTSSKSKYADNLKHMCDTWGKTWCDGNVTALSDNSSSSNNKDMRALFPRLTIFEVPDSNNFGNYKGYFDKATGDYKGYIDEATRRERMLIAFRAQIIKLIALFEIFKALPTALTSDTWLCYLDDDMYVNVPALVSELRGVPLPLTGPGRWIADAGITPGQQWKSNSTGEPPMYSNGGFCMDSVLALAVANSILTEYAIHKDRVLGMGPDDTGFASWIRRQLGHTVVDSKAWFSQNSAPVRLDGGDGPDIEPGGGAESLTLGKVNMRVGPDHYELARKKLISGHDLDRAFLRQRKERIPLDALAQVSVIAINNQGGNLDFDVLARRLDQPQPTTVSEKWALWHTFISKQWQNKGLALTVDKMVKPTALRTRKSGYDLPLLNAYAEASLNCNIDCPIDPLSRLQQSGIRGRCFNIHFSEGPGRWGNQVLRVLSHFTTLMMHGAASIKLIGKWPVGLIKGTDTFTHPGLVNSKRDERSDCIDVKATSWRFQNIKINDTAPPASANLADMFFLKQYMKMQSQLSPFLFACSAIPASVSCPSSHPYAYRPAENFDYCCATGNSQDTLGINSGPRAGRSTTCAEAQFIRCSVPPCADYVNKSNHKDDNALPSMPNCIDMDRQYAVVTLKSAAHTVTWKDVVVIHFRHGDVIRAQREKVPNLNHLQPPCAFYKDVILHGRRGAPFPFVILVSGVYSRDEIGPCEAEIETMFPEKVINTTRFKHDHLGAINDPMLIDLALLTNAVNLVESHSTMTMATVLLSTQLRRHFFVTMPHTVTSDHPLWPNIMGRRMHARQLYRKSRVSQYGYYIRDLFGDPKGVIDVNKDMTREVVHEGIEYAKKHSIFERLKGYDGNMVKTLI